MSRRRTKPRTVWYVLCLLGNGRRAGDCGHNHRTSMAAVTCRFEPIAYKRDPGAGLHIMSVTL